VPLLLQTYRPRTLIHPGTYGTLGYSLPAAVGAKLACRKQPVMSISGDGRHIGSELTNPDFVKLGEAFGVKSARVETKDLGATVRRANEAGGVWLIEIPFAPEGPATMVPWMPRERTQRKGPAQPAARSASYELAFK
jgi:acetolactate synthase-1/2/3 large subunit